MKSETKLCLVSSLIKTVIAIDPGKNGAMAVMRGTEIFTHPFDFDRPLEIREFLKQFRGADCVAYMEKVGGYVPKKGEGQPGSRMFTFGDCNGYVRGLLDAFEIPTKFVLPQVWQKGVTVGGLEYSARKKILRDHAQKLFPGLKVTANDGDALGILHYARFVETGANPGYGKPALPSPVAKPRQLPASMAEQMRRAVAWCESKGWPVPPKGSPERATMCDYWAEAYLNGETP